MLPWHEFRHEKQLPQDTAVPPKPWGTPTPAAEIMGKTKFPNHPILQGIKGENPQPPLPQQVPHLRSDGCRTARRLILPGWSTCQRWESLGGQLQESLMALQGREWSQRALGHHPGMGLQHPHRARPPSQPWRDKGGKKRSKAQCHAKSRSPSSSSFRASRRARSSSVGREVTACDVGTATTSAGLGRTSAVGWGDQIHGEAEGRSPRGRTKRSPVPSGSVTALGNTLGHTRHPSARQR